MRRIVASEFGFTRIEVVRDRSRCPGSRHCVAEAIDAYTRDLRPEGNGRRLFDFVVFAGHGLDVQAVIFNRRVVGFGRWEERRYTGKHPHDDHVHLEFNDRAGTHVTEAEIRAVLAEWKGEEAFLVALSEAEQRALLADVVYIKDVLNLDGREKPPVPADLRGVFLREFFWIRDRTRRMEKAIERIETHLGITPAADG